MTTVRELPELVRDSKLEVILHDNITIHTEPLECRDGFLPQRWETRRMIGHGGSGSVFLQHKVDGPGTMHSLAVKQMPLTADLASEDHDSKRYLRELEALAKFAQGKYSRYFVRSYGWYHEADWLYICMEYCKHQDLGKYLKAHGTLSEEYARTIAQQVLQGLFQMHENMIAHRDLKPGNILIQRRPPEDDAWWVVLGDLGLSRRSGASSGTTTVRGTPDFMAPETIGKPFLGDPKQANPFSADIWSLGETLSRALTGHRTFPDNEHLIRYQGYLLSFPNDALRQSGVSAEAVDFIHSLMEVNPLLRLTAADALKHPWITRSSNSTTGPYEPTSIPYPLSVNPEDPLSHSQITQASGQWTLTQPVRSYDTQASAAWTETGPISALHRGSASPFGQLPAYQRSPYAVLDQVQAWPTIEEAPSKAGLFLLPEDITAPSPAKNRRRIPEKQRAMVRKDMRENNRKQFSKNLQFQAPIPAHLIANLNRGTGNQEETVSWTFQQGNEKDVTHGMTADAPFASGPSQPFSSSSYLRTMEANFMKDFTCCGLALASLHDLLQHFEETHANAPAPPPPPPPSQPMQSSFETVHGMPVAPAEVQQSLEVNPEYGIDWFRTM